MRISDWISDVCSSDLAEILARDAEIVGAREAKAEKNGVVVALQGVERQLAPEALFQDRPDAANGENIGRFALGETVDRLVGRSEDSRVGNEGVSTFRSRWLPYP